MRTFSSDAPIAIIGLGVMGAKVAWATARAGIPVRGYDVDPARARAAFDRALGWSDGAEREKVRSNLTVAGSLPEALIGVQLAFENVPEDAKLKHQVLAEVGALLDSTSYLGSNTSSMLASPLGVASGRPDRFFSLNFTDPRSMRLVELMGSTAAAPETLAFARAWAAAIGMIPIDVKKEQMGYSFNRLWRVIKKEVLRQIADGYASPEDIDRAWMLAFGTSFGPCGLMDEVGLESIKKIEETYFSATGDPSDRPPQFLVEMIAAGKKGVATGEGFYHYPDPEYRRPEFLSVTRR